MKKKIYLFTTVLLSAAVLSLSSCLKDNAHYVDFSKGGTFVDFNLGGFVNFTKDAITETPDSDANGSIVRQFSVNVASVNLPTTATTVTLAVGDAADVTTLNSLQSNVVYELMPTNAYSFTTTKVTIPAGKQNAITSVTFYKNLLDPSKSYVLPIKITDGGGQKLSANLNIHYYHFIGNDFAGAYEHIFDRWNVPDSTKAGNHDFDNEDEGQDLFSPVTPTKFTVISDYYNGIPYTVTFTKTGSGSTATYSNFVVQFTADDIANYWTANGIVLTAGPQIRSLSYNYDPSRQYTFAESLKLFRFYYTTATRAVIDTYIKP